MIGNIATTGYGPVVLGSGIGTGLTGAKNQEVTTRQPELKRYLRISMFLSIAFTEALGFLDFMAGLTFGS